MPLQIGMHAQTPFSPSGLVEVVGIEDIHPLMPRQTVLVRFLDPIPTATPLALWDATSAMNFGRSARITREGRPASPRRILHLTEGAMGFLDVPECTSTTEAPRAVTDFSRAVLEDSRPAPTLASASRGEPKSALKMAPAGVPHGRRPHRLSARLLACPCDGRRPGTPSFPLLPGVAPVARGKPRCPRVYGFQEGLPWLRARSRRLPAAAPPAPRSAPAPAAAS
jgi:hypothetical protein